MFERNEGKSVGDWLRERKPPDGLAPDGTYDDQWVEVNGEKQFITGVQRASLQATGHEVVAIENSVKRESELGQGSLPGFDRGAVEPVEVADGGPSEEMVRQAERGVVDKADKRRRRRLNQ